MGSLTTTTAGMGITGRLCQLAPHNPLSSLGLFLLGNAFPSKHELPTFIFLYFSCNLLSSSTVSSHPTRSITYHLLTTLLPPALSPAVFPQPFANRYWTMPLLYLPFYLHCIWNKISFALCSIQCPCHVIWPLPAPPACPCAVLMYCFHLSSAPGSAHLRSPCKDISLTWPSSALPHQLHESPQRGYGHICTAGGFPQSLWSHLHHLALRHTGERGDWFVITLRQQASEWLQRVQCENYSP